MQLTYLFIAFIAAATGNPGSPTLDSILEKKGGDPCTGAQKDIFWGKLVGALAGKNSTEIGEFGGITGFYPSTAQDENSCLSPAKAYISTFTSSQADSCIQNFDKIVGEFRQSGSDSGSHSGSDSGSGSHSGSDGSHSGSDGSHSGSDGSHSGSDGSHSGSDGSHSGSDGSNSGSDGSHSGSDGSHSGSDGPHSGSGSDSGSDSQSSSDSHSGSHLSTHVSTHIGSPSTSPHTNSPTSSSTIVTPSPNPRTLIIPISTSTVSHSSLVPSIAIPTPTFPIIGLK